jgi:foldase protein PrsA
VAKPGSSTASLEHVCRVEYAALRQQALAFLISSRWLTGEAAEEGMRVSAREVQQQLQQRKRSFPSESEFNESLQAIAHSVADVEREIEGDLAAQKLRRRLIAKEPRITSAEIAAYYRRNIARFHVPEQREFDIVENLRSEAIARRQMREAKAGKHLLSLHESFPRKPFTDYVGEKRTIYEAIFKAQPHVFTGPIRLNEFYFLIRVTHIAPGRVEPLRRVHGAIEKRISAERDRKTLARFVSAWRLRWRARTDCRAGYVVQKCRQYAGPKTAEEPLALN